MTQQIPTHLIGKRVRVTVPPFFSEALQEWVNPSTSGVVQWLGLNNNLSGFRQVTIGRSPFRLESWDQLTEEPSTRPEGRQFD